MEKKISPAKVVVLGEGNLSKSLICEARVGKTSLTHRFVSGSFSEKQQITVDATCMEKYGHRAFNIHLLQNCQGWRIDSQDGHLGYRWPGEISCS